MAMPAAVMGCAVAMAAAAHLHVRLYMSTRARPSASRYKLSKHGFDAAFGSHACQNLESRQLAQDPRQA